MKENNLSTKRFGLYVHVPFCERHCPYCNFSITVTKRIPQVAFVEAIKKEISSRSIQHSREKLASISFGGGTPSLLDPTGIQQIIRHARELFGPTTTSEISLECNPEHASEHYFEALILAGITRISFGVQSFHDSALITLNRKHSGEQAKRAIKQAKKAGFRVSIDLIYGIPETSIKEFKQDLATAIALDVEHLSVYELTYEEKTSFMRRKNRGIITPWNEDQLINAAQYAEKTLSKAEFTHYEVSNFARLKGESEHNLLYWRGDAYLGAGPGAHGLAFIDGKIIRRANTPSLKRYLQGDLIQEIQQISPCDHVLELVMVGLRIREGFDCAKISMRTGISLDPLYPLMHQWAKEGFGELKKDRFMPSNKGLTFADAMIRAFVMVFDCEENAK